MRLIIRFKASVDFSMKSLCLVYNNFSGFSLLPKAQEHLKKKTFLEMYVKNGNIILKDGSPP